MNTYEVECDVCKTQRFTFTSKYILEQPSTDGYVYGLTNFNKPQNWKIIVRHNYVRAICPLCMFKILNK